MKPSDLFAVSLVLLIRSLLENLVLNVSLAGDGHHLSQDVQVTVFSFWINRFLIASSSWNKTDEKWKWIFTNMLLGLSWNVGVLASMIPYYKLMAKQSSLVSLALSYLRRARTKKNLTTTKRRKTTLVTLDIWAFRSKSLWVFCHLPPASLLSAF